VQSSASSRSVTKDRKCLRPDPLIWAMWDAFDCVEGQRKRSKWTESFDLVFTTKRAGQLPTRMKMGGGWLPLKFQQ
jgi:hypothetical protein